MNTLCIHDCLNVVRLVGGLTDNLCVQIDAAINPGVPRCLVPCPRFGATCTEVNGCQALIPEDWTIACASTQGRMNEHERA
eukprot:618864-Pleurochrysis_carterae.AAC.1